MILNYSGIQILHYNLVANNLIFRFKFVNLKLCIRLPSREWKPPFSNYYSTKRSAKAFISFYEVPRFSFESLSMLNRHHYRETLNAVSVHTINQRRSLVDEQIFELSKNLWLFVASFYVPREQGKRQNRRVEYFTRNRAAFAVKGIIKRRVVKENSTLSVSRSNSQESPGIMKSL